ncbi:hypothetical protein K6U06_17635, partial [Acidiferrimicrobium sp. IK]|uniref:hypothetical protein n=1 Tax=Acidiferrimicrobium sp. IK TaxID=2871700 RepID=UPI0021CAF956
TVNVTVTTPTQTSATTTSDTFTYTAQYSVTLAASTTAPQAGQTVTLTATANTDVGPTPYGLSIVDTTTNTLLAHVGTGTTVTTTVTQNTATTQNYVGRIDTQGGDPVAATSTPITVTWTATTPPPPPAALSEAASFPVNSESDGNSSIAVTPQKVGDLLIVSMQLHSTSVEVKSVSGGNGGTWHRATRFVDSANTLSYEVWYTSATRTGTADITLTYSAPTALPIELIADSFTGAPHGSWSVVASGGRSNAASSAIYWPRLTSGKASLQLYWGASEEHTAGTGVTTPGFVAQDTANGNEFIADPSLAPLTAYSPVGTDSPANVSTAVGVIFAAS